MSSCRNAEAVGGRSKTTKPGMRYKRAPVDPAAVFFNLPVLHMPQASCEYFSKTKPQSSLELLHSERPTLLPVCSCRIDWTLWCDDSRWSLSARVHYLGGARTCPTGDNVRLGERPIKTRQLPTTPRHLSFLKEGREEDSSVCDGEGVHNKKWEGVASSACCCALISFIRFQIRAALHTPFSQTQTQYNFYNFPYIFPFKKKRIKKK